MKVRPLRDLDGKTDNRYVISEDGSYIRDNRSGNKLGRIHIHQRYRSVSIKLNGKYYHQIKICQLQWLAWRGIIPDKYVLHHKDGNKINDHIENLDCMPKSEHVKYHTIGEKNGMWGKHHTEEALKKQREAMIGKKHRLGKCDSEETKRKKSIAISGEKNYFYNKHFWGEKNHQAKLVSVEVEEIRKSLYIDNLSYKDLADKYDISVSCIYHIDEGHTWNPDHFSKSELIKQLYETYNRG